jgi:hypothetical protein
MAHLPFVMLHIFGKARADAYSLYAIKVDFTAGKRKATLFLGREVIVG